MLMCSEWQEYQFHEVKAGMLHSTTAVSVLFKELDPLKICKQWDRK